jgi:predicted nucleic acid-binding protein
MIVLDANILIRAVLGRRVRQLIEAYGAGQIRFYAPQAAFDDAEKYLPPLLEKRGKSAVGVSQSLQYLQLLVEPVNRETFGDFEEEARLRLCGRDEDDWPVLAAVLALDCPIWSEDTDFLGTGVAVWTSNRIEIFLKAQSNSSAPDIE